MTFSPKFTITHHMTQAITRIERARGFMEAARLSDDWVRDMGNEALIKEAHYTTHIEGTRLTLDQSERLWKGEAVPEADPEDTRELLNYRSAFEFVSECLKSGDPITEGMIREIQMVEIKERGEQVIRRDVLVKKYGLNDRQAKALGLMMKKNSVHISEIEEFCPGVTRRTLQRDLNVLTDLKLVQLKGSARQSNYELIK